MPMTFTWTGLHLLEAQSATADCFIVRNADLVQGRETNPAFIYTTPTVSFASPAVPTVEIDSLGPLPWKDSLVSTLTPVFQVLASAETEVTKMIRVAASYEWTAVASSSQQGPTQTLVNSTAALMNPAQEFSTQNCDDFTKTLATQLAKWQGLVGVPGDGAVLSLAITMFATIEGSQVPLVTMRDVRFTLADGWWEHVDLPALAGSRTR
jgi:hypothetical protein